MLMISTCPRCQEPVSIPTGVEVSALVRCPLCAEEYALSEALAAAPPELVPVASSPAGGEPIEPIRNFEEENEAAAVAKQFANVSVTPRRRRKPKSAIRTLIEIITGGLAGCLLAYYGLAFYYGPDFRNKGLPQLPLPGVSWLTAQPPGNDAKQPPPAEKPAKENNVPINPPNRT
jgi:hypothetical protein